MNLVVAGPRRWSDAGFVSKQLDQVRQDNELRLFVGDAAGVDRATRVWAILRGIPIQRFIADWPAFGKSAGVKRSAEMLDAAGTDASLLAFCPAAQSLTTGTGHTIGMALARGIPVTIVSPDGRAWYSLAAGSPAYWTAAFVQLARIFGLTLSHRRAQSTPDLLQ